MKIDMAPWVESHTMDMDKLYTELTLEQVENKPTGPAPVKLESYTELFTEKETTDQQQSHPDPDSEPPRKKSRKIKRKKILAKGEPGMGKSTFARKMAYDWAKGVFTAVSVIFFVSMKLIRPGQSIENIIIEQVPPLEALEIDEGKLKNILDTLGHKCLIIFDGLDEHDLGTNVDVKKIIEGRKLLGCNVFLTSRPHNTETIERFFPTHVSVRGFSKHHATEFISNCVQNAGRAQAVMCFSVRNFTSKVSAQLSPMLLLFLTILVNLEEMDLTRQFIPLGEIYFRLVRCIYKKYCKRKEILFRESKFLDVLKKVGKVSWEMLKSGKSWAKRSDIVGEVGEDAFEIGLLIGHKDFRLSGDETADISITCPHLTIQEFLGSFGFLQMLNEGQSIDSLLSDGHEGQKIMQSPYFLRFCLWFLDGNHKGRHFSFSQRQSILGSLVSHSANQVNLVQLDMMDLKRLVPILHLHLISDAERGPVLKFIQEILSKCDKTREFYVPSISYFPFDNLPELVSSFPPHAAILSDRKADEKTFTVIESASNLEALQKVLNCCEEKVVHPCLLLAGDTNDVDVSMAAHGSLRKLSLFGLQQNWCRVTSEQEFHFCTFLTDIRLENVKIDVQVLDSLETAVRTDKLPCLSRLGFKGCGLTLKGKLSRLFNSMWPSLTHLNLDRCCLNADDIKTLSNCLTARRNKKLPKLSSLALHLTEVEGKGSLRPALKAMFQKSLPAIRTLVLNELQSEEYQIISAAVNNRKLLNLTTLSVSLGKRPPQFPDVIPVKDAVHGEGLNVLKSRSLSDLTMNRFICSPLHLNTAAMSAQSSEVTKLDISHGSGISGSLSILLCHSFPSLETLILSDCGLNSDDLSSLAQAGVEGRLPELKHLDLSDNEALIGKWRHLFSVRQRWSHLLSLNIKQNIHTEQDQHFDALVHSVRLGALGNLQQFTVSAGCHNGDFLFSSCPRVKWPNVQLLDIHCGHKYGSAEYIQLFQKAVQGIVEKDLFPRLDTLCVNSKFVSKTINFAYGSFNNCLDNIMQSVTELVYLQELAETCFSLITTSVSDQTKESAYLKYVQGLKKVNSAMVATSSMNENPFGNNSFLLKLMRTASSYSTDPRVDTARKSIVASAYSNFLYFFSGQPVDLQPIASALHELVDMDGSLTETDKSLWKLLIDFLCKNVQLFINGEPLDLQSFGSLMHKLIDYVKDLTEYERSALKFCADTIYCFLNGEPVNLQPMCAEILSWVDNTCDVSERNLIKPVVEIACTRLQLVFNGESIDMQPVCDKVQEVIEEFPDISQSDRLFSKALVDILCTGVECIFRRPFSLQPVCKKLNEYIDELPECPEAERPVLKYVADVVCSCLECLFRRPVDLHPAWSLFQEWIDTSLGDHFEASELPTVRFILKLNVNMVCAHVQCLLNRSFTPQRVQSLLHSWIDRTPNLSESERSDSKLLADLACDGLQRMTTECSWNVHGIPNEPDTSIFSRFKSTDLQQCMLKLCSSHEAVKNLNKLRDLKHTLRKRGIRVYTHHSV